MQRGIADNAYLSKWAGGLGGLGLQCVAPAVTFRELMGESGHYSIPQTPQ